VWQVGLLRAGAWTARGLRVPARNALLADVVPPAAYGRAYGFERAMDNLGAIIGPLLALGLVATIGTRWAITVSVIPGLLAAGAIVYAIRHTTTPTKRDKTPIRLQIRPVLAVAGAAAFAIAYVGLATDTSNWIALAPWFIAAGIGIGAVETAQHAAVATATPDHVRGSAFGLLAGVQSLGNLIASTTTGIIWTTIGPGWAFGIIGVAMIAATAVLATAQPDNCPA
jgi:MFS family permease